MFILCASFQHSGSLPCNLTLSGSLTRTQKTLSETCPRRAPPLIYLRTVSGSSIQVKRESVHMLVGSKSKINPQHRNGHHIKKNKKARYCNTSEEANAHVYLQQMIYQMFPIVVWAVAKSLGRFQASPWTPLHLGCLSECLGLQL